MKFVLDMNISPDWVDAFTSAGLESIHWSDVGKMDASDTEILQWTASNGYILVTHDLDFGELLALTGGSAPSVVQVRVNDILSCTVDRVIAAIRQFESELTAGALISVRPDSARVRILPFHKP